MEAKRRDEMSHGVRTFFNVGTPVTVYAFSFAVQCDKTSLFVRTFDT